MKNPRFAILILFVLSILLNIGMSSYSSNNQDDFIERIMSVTNDSIDKNYIFFGCGHHGMIWSKIAFDSIGIHLSNGTTRTTISDEQPSDTGIDTITFIENNIHTINWGIDSLYLDAKLFDSRPSDIYNPVYQELYVIKNGNLFFHHSNAENIIGLNSNKFNHKLHKLMNLMLWIASPPLRQYIPAPADSLTNK